MKETCGHNGDHPLRLPLARQHCHLKVGIPDGGREGECLRLPTCSEELAAEEWDGDA